jgi:hypothetical protein
VFGEGKVRFLRNDTDEQTLRGFISRNGSEMRKPK